MICKHGLNAHRSGDAEWIVCFEENRQREREVTRYAVSLVALIVILTIALKLLHAYLFYGDLTCAFSECRKVIDVAP